MFSINATGKDWLYNLKFNRTYQDPLFQKPENFGEIIDQTFTYYASFNAAIDLFKRYTWISDLNMNLGSKNGTDIESNVSSNGDIVLAEVFAVVNPNNNSKLRKELDNVITRSPSVMNQHAINTIHHIYFHCPDPKGYFRKKYNNYNLNNVILDWLGV